MQDKKVLIIGGENCGLTALRIAELKYQHPELIVVDMETAKQLGLSQSFEYKARPELPEPIILKPANAYGFNFGSKSNRAMRREAERKKNKKR